MTDRELLELAAKAAELRISNKLTSGGLSVCSNARPAPHNWNPLTDDGDALRLAVKSGIDLVVSVARPARSGACPPGGGVNDYLEEEHGADPYAATRRAIVRAAAEIGKGVT